MKKTIKFIVIAAAVLAVLTALSCSDGASLSGRDYKEYKDQFKAEYTNSSRIDDVDFSGVSLTYSATNVADSAKEQKITFPKEADILRETNDIEAKLKEFLSFSQYENPTATPGVYTPSKLTTPVDYSFIRREGNNDVIIIVAVPNINKIVAKIDATKYKVYGQLYDKDGDGKGGEALYDDQYKELDIASGAGTLGAFSNPVRDAETLTITGPTSGTFTNANAKTTVGLATFSLLGDNDNAIYRKVLSDLKDKIELQKYDKSKKEWVKEGNAELFEYRGTAHSEGGWSVDYLYVTINPLEDLGIYRIKATGIKNLATAENIGDAPRKIKVAVGSGSASFFQETGYTEPALYNNTNIHQWENSPVSTYIIASNTVKKADVNKKNVVIELYFNAVADSLDSASTKWLEEIDLDKFKNAFKLVYNGDVPNTEIANGANLNDQKNIVEIGITNVKYEVSKRYDLDNTNKNCITITLDKNFKLSQNGDLAVSLLLSPEFKYAGGHITFGSNDLTASYYNGSYFWRSYGELVKL